MIARNISITALALAAAGCTTPANLPTGADAYSIIPAQQQATTLREYRIQPPDKITVIVFREPDMSLSDIEVDTAGRVTLPLIGSVEAAGKTTDELSALISTSLRRYLAHPEVAVYVSSAVSQRVVVEGQVNQPGIYDFRGRTTLLGALALARGPSRVAALREVAIFRNVNGQRMAAKFDLPAIRRGEAPDPEILASDTVVVGYSGIKGAWRDFLQAAPAFAIFRPLYD